MKFLNRMERKFGRYAIHNLMYYMVIIQLIGTIMYSFAPTRVFALNYLSLDIAAVLRGQVWRLFTFIIAGSPISLANPLDVLFTAISLYFYYYIGRSLENVWGAFRFNLYYLSGIVFNIIAAFIAHFIFVKMLGASFPFYLGLSYINQALFLACAVMYPDNTVYVQFLFPIKMKYLGILYGVMILVDVFSAFSTGNLSGYVQGISIIIGLLNFIIFFLCTRNYRKISPKQVKRKSAYRAEVRSVQKATRHQCAVCGRTEQDDETLDFRFCSKCEGSYEYCSDHLFTHQHVKRH